MASRSRSARALAAAAFRLVSYSGSVRADSSSESSSAGDTSEPEVTASACSGDSSPFLTASSVLGREARRLEVANLRRAAVRVVPVLREMSSSADLAPLRFHACDSSYRAAMRVTAPPPRRPSAAKASNTAGTSPMAMSPGSRRSHRSRTAATVASTSVAVAGLLAMRTTIANVRS